MHEFMSFEDVSAVVGKSLGETEWVSISQERIDSFALATGDHQWIHVDQQRAATSPFGTTIAHGFLVLSMVIPMMKTFYTFPRQRMALNYGLGSVRFPNPVLVDSRIRAEFGVVGAEQKPDGGIQVAWSATVEREGTGNPVCVAELLTRVYLD